MKQITPNSSGTDPEFVTAGLAGLIWLRERFLNLITGNTHMPALNDFEGELTHHIYSNLAVEIRVKLKEILTTATDEDGSYVDYSKVIDDPAYHSFKESLTPRLKSFDPILLGTREERLAFWINLYNALVMDGVITFGVKKSILDMGMAGLIFFRKAAYLVGGQRISCDDIEHGILRSNRGHPFIPGPQFAENDPRRAWVVEPPDLRIHFALNCASRSCPPVHYYNANLLENQLDLAVKNFLSDTVRIDVDQHTLRLSKIFQWYQGDFGGREGVINFLISFHTDEDKRRWISKNRRTLRLRYEPYNWHLNSPVADH